jgi:mannan endo-1,4-beta-mannosidase
MKKMLLLSLVASCLFSCGQRQATEQTLTPVRPIVDKNATPETVALYNRLDALLDEGIMLGHQDALMYGMAGEVGVGWRVDWNNNDPIRSDVKESTGKYPAVFGFEIGHIEVGKEKSLDHVYFRDIKRGVREAHQMGGIVTISWHGNNPVTYYWSDEEKNYNAAGSSWDVKGSAVQAILPDGEHHKRFLGWLDVLADFFLDLKDEDGKLIPVIFRPYHEHTGSWFWWGANFCTPEEYKQLWRMTIDYFQRTHSVHNLLYAYSPSWVPDEAKYLERYPGDEYVDIIGFDVYANNEGDVYNPATDYYKIENYQHNMRTMLDIITNYAAESGKIPAITETGMEGFEYEHFFTNALYNVIKDYRISHFHFWRNSYDKPRHYWAAFPGCLNEQDFIDFVNKPGILMLDDIKDIR